LLLWNHTPHNIKGTRYMPAKRKQSKKPSSATPNKSPTGKQKAAPKPRGGGAKQGHNK
jgi:hypothetical protein